MITKERMTELFVWTRTAPMFSSSPEGKVFAEELREVFCLACQTLEDRDIDFTDE